MTQESAYIHGTYPLKCTIMIAESGLKKALSETISKIISGQAPDIEA
jgi:hypothetical protein